MIGDGRTVGLVHRNGSIDWLCLPRFDSGACFAALLGTPEHGRFLLAPVGEVHSVSRAYRRGTLVLLPPLTVSLVMLALVAGH